MKADRKEIIFTEKATKPTAWYSQAVKAGDFVFFAGVCGDDPVTGEIMGKGDIRTETRYAMENLKNTAIAAGISMEDIVKVTVCVKDISMMREFNQVYPEYFPGDPPARIALAVKDLGGGANLELDAMGIVRK